MNTCDRTWSVLVTGSLTTFHIGLCKWRNDICTPFSYISTYQVFSVRVGGCNSDVVYKVIVCYPLPKLGLTCMKLGGRVGRKCIRGGHYVRFLVRSPQGDGDARDSLRFMWRISISDCNLGNTLQRGIEITLTRILLIKERFPNCIKCKIFSDHFVSRSSWPTAKPFTHRRRSYNCSRTTLTAKAFGRTFNVSYHTVELRRLQFPIQLSSVPASVERFHLAPHCISSASLIVNVGHGSEAYSLANTISYWVGETDFLSRPYDVTLQPKLSYVV